MRRRSTFSGQSPYITLVATPIGNLGELSGRALEALKEADLIGCEDTRVTGNLLSLNGLKKKLIKVEKHNETEGGHALVEAALSGRKVAYVSDAGYPGLSDPGQIIVRLALEAGVNVSLVNGSNALLPALIGSGFDAEHFYFEGFLPRKRGDRLARLKALAHLPCTSLYYEAPHRLEETLEDMSEIYGSRRACLARELTKIHEEYIDGTIPELLDLVKEDCPKGEFVIVVERAAQTAKEITDEEITLALKKALEALRGKEAVEEVSQALGIPKKRAYALYLKLKD